MIVSFAILVSEWPSKGSLGNIVTESNITDLVEILSIQNISTSQTNEFNSMPLPLGDHDEAQV